ncbi:MAG: tRNA (adenosine(37)-N6)-threonylcarbamoyltransferase complex transferase subunit TsaD, partial [Patescibacteria group bacterium]
HPLDVGRVTGSSPVSRTMITLGIETSCDETALCLLETKENTYRILGNIVHSQIDVHKEFGGVVPMLAKREHLKNLPLLYTKILKDSGVEESSINSIAVTAGPGLEPALWTGILFAQELGKRLSIPVQGVNHMEGHILASLIPDTSIDTTFKDLLALPLPALALLISGGHTEIVKVNAVGSYEVIGKTKDDAVGEAFDKVARMLQLPYPGGPEISKLAEKARRENLPKVFTLPRPLLHSKDLLFSFSGLKTAVLYALQKHGEPNDAEKADLAREFEDAVTEVLITKVTQALETHAPETLILGGGVIANTHIRKAFEELASSYRIPLLLPALGLTGDNALMIALTGNMQKAPTSFDIRASGNLSL